MSEIHLQNATAFVATCCEERQGQKPMWENGIKITSQNGMGAKETRKKKVYGENKPAINTNEKTPRIQDAFGVAGSLVFPHLFNVITSNFL